jgi:hypothetical protein
MVMMDELFGYRYMVERGGVCYEERGYLRQNYSKLLGEDAKISWKWASYRNAYEFYTKEAAAKGFNKSGLDGPAVIYKTHTDKPEMWECQGTI